MSLKQDTNKEISTDSSPEDSPLLLSGERSEISSRDQSLQCNSISSASLTAPLRASDDRKCVQWGSQSVDKGTTAQNQCQNTLETLLQSQRIDSLLLQNVYTRTLTNGNFQVIAMIVTTLRDNEFSIHIAPRAGRRVTEQTSLMQLVQRNKCLPVDNSMSALLMQQYAKDITLDSVISPGDTITISGASALMLAAFNGSADAVTRLTPEMGLLSNDGWSALMLAASEGHTECVQLLYGEVNLCGFTMLMYAVACNDCDRAHRFIHLAKRQVSLRHDKGWSALMLAVKLRHYKIASLLVSEEAKLQTTNDWVNDYTALHMLAKYSKDEDGEDSNYQFVAEALLQEEGDIRNERGETPLMIAASSGNRWLVQLICSKPEKWSAAIKAQTYEGKTALMYAAERGHLEICKLLANSEAQFSTNDGKTALMFASEGGHSGIVQLLYQIEGGMMLSDPLSSGKTALMFTAECGHVEVANILVDIEKERVTKDGTTALMLAATANQDGIIDILETEARAQDKRGRTALILAAQAGAVACAKLLARWEVGIRDQHGNTALMHAVRNGHIEIVSLLVDDESGVTNENGYSALMIASEVGDRNACELLSSEVGISGYTNLMFLAATKAASRNFDQYESQVGKCAVNGITALMLAAINNSVDAVTYLIAEAGAQDWEGNTALMYACKSGFDSIVEILMGHETGFRNKDGMTALMLAAYYGNCNCLKLLLAKEGSIPDDDGNRVDFYAKYPNHDDYDSRAQILALLCKALDESDSMVKW
ncbi:Ankyrin repeat protein [Giardia duodenalis]|uniref:Protein 21.1 n=2 Tax=Giardia intestinalis TaxID=5741 RepID=C6LNS8_GIAIB|nr:Protein 21.1 [Giardia intestinalis ATCC 50581]ESU45388.1 Ankyrin repeat protein [Giardia intestinalis]